MFILSQIKQRIGDYLQFETLRQHRSKLGRILAPKYTAYLQKSRAAFSDSTTPRSETQKAVGDFQSKGFASFHTPETKQIAQEIFSRVREEEQRGLDIWDADYRYRDDIYTKFSQIDQLFRGPLGDFLTTHYRSHFKIYYGIMYKSERRAERAVGSQLWHADGGPGTCINVMFYLKNVELPDGAMECLPWDLSLQVFRKEILSRIPEVRIRQAQQSGRSLSNLEQRTIKCEYYREEIEESFATAIEQPTGPAGLVLPFSNNILHKGGYPEAGRSRYVCVFHCYPSHKPTLFERYRERGIGKRSSFPQDPAEDF